MDRVAILTGIVGGLGLLWLVVEVRSPSGPRVNPRAPQPPAHLVVSVRGPEAPPRLPHRIDVHHHHHLGAPAAWPAGLGDGAQRFEVIDGEIVEPQLLPRRAGR